VVVEAVVPMPPRADNKRGAPLASALLLCCHVLFPFVLWQASPSPLDKVIMVSLFVFLAACASLVETWSRATGPLRITWLEMALLGWLGWKSLHFLFWSDDLVARTPVAMASILGCFAILTGRVHGLIGLRQVAMLSALLVGLLGAHGLMQFLHLDPLAPYLGTTEDSLVQSLFNHRNFYAAYLAAGMPLALFGTFREGGSRRLLLSGCLCFGAVGLVLALSRGALLGVAVAGGMALLWTRTDQLVPRVITSFRWTVVSLGIALSVLAVLVWQVVPEMEQRRLFDFEGTSVRERVLLADRALGAITENPWAGHGQGSTPLLLARQRSRELGVLRTSPVEHVHQELLELLLEEGWLGVAVFLGMLGVALKTMAALLRKGDRETRGLALAFGCSAVVGFSQAMVDLNLRYMTGLYGFFLALGGLITLAHRSSVVQVTVPRPFLWFARGTILALAGLALGHTWQLFLARTHQLRGGFAQAAGRYLEAESLFARAGELSPYLLEIDEAVYENLAASGRAHEDLLEHVRQVLNRQPEQPRWLFRAAWHLAALGSIRESLELGAKAYASDPHLPGCFTPLQFLDRKADRVEEFAAMVRAHAVNEPDNVFYLYSLYQLELAAGNAAAALSMAERLHRAAPGNLSFTLAYGRGLLAFSKPQKVVEVLAPHGYQVDTPPGFNLLLGQAYETLGQTWDACPLYRREIELHPANGEAYRFLFRCQLAAEAFPAIEELFLDLERRRLALTAESRTLLDRLIDEELLGKAPRSWVERYHYLVGILAKAEPTEVSP